MTLSVSKVRLDNGLQVILKEVHTAPVVSTWIWYRVGSRNEVEGHTGISHWVEHMMFKGSSQFPKGAIMRSVDRYGGYVNAMTSMDFTAYYETLPSDHAELALRIEADRMTTATFDADEVAAERTVVIAEREGSENEPSFVLSEDLVATAFRVHPYHHQTIGWKADLQAITRDQLYAHYKSHYAPNNAVLVVVGDFDTPAYLAMVERYFASIPAGELPPQAIREEPPQRGERRLTVRMPGSAPILRISFHAPAVSHADYIPMVVLDAVLSGGKAMFAFGDSPSRSARLYRALVETQLASSVGSGYHPSLDPYLFTLGATVRDGRQAEEVEAALLAEMTKLTAEPVHAHELAVAIRQTQAQFAYSSESVTSQALTLGFLEMCDHHARMEGLLDEIARVTPADVLRVARTYLGEDNRVVGRFTPTTPGDAAEDHELMPPPQSLMLHPGRVAYWSGARRPAISPETVVRQTLDNGLVVLIRENPTSPSVTIEGEMEAGSVFDTDATLGLGGLTLAMLRRGTQQHTFQEINTALDDVGASLSFGSGMDGIEFGGHALTQDLDLVLELLAEVLMQPIFPEEELQKLRGQILTHLGILEMDTSYRADQAFMAALYPSGHPYGRPGTGTRDTVRAFSAADLQQFYRAHYHPETGLISVVGAVEAPRVLAMLNARLGQWRAAGPAPVRLVPPAQTPPEIITRQIELPGKAQADLVWGVVGMGRAAPDYYPAMMANLILGRLGLMGRLGENVRDQQGLAYYVSSSVHAGSGPHPWSIEAGVHPQNVARAVSSILREVERLREEPVRDEELEDGRAYLIGALPLHLETNEGIADFLLNIERYGLGLDYLQRYPSIIRGITREDMQRTVRQYLTLDHYVLTMAGTFST